MVFPGGLPWLDQEASLARWVTWYAAVGLVRGGAATEGLYGVRVNGLVLRRATRAWPGRWRVTCCPRRPPG